MRAPAKNPVGPFKWYNGCVHGFPAGLLRDENGSALVSVLVVILAVSILFSVTVAGAYYRNRLVNGRINAAKALYMAEAGIYRKMDDLAMNGFSMDGADEEISLWDGGTATVSARPEGGMVRLTSAATAGKEVKRVDALVGQRIPADLRKAIVLGRSRSALVLAGHADITGDVVVYLDGVKPSKVPGHYFKGKKLVNGRVEARRELALPATGTELPDRFIERAKNVLAAPGMADRHVQGTLVLRQPDLDSLGTGCLYVQGDIIITSPLVCRQAVTLAATGAITVSGDGSLHGVPELFAYHGITVKDGAVVRNSVLFSPENISVGGNALFSGQAVSEADISVKDDAVVEYPAVLISRGRRKGTTLTGSVNIGDRARVRAACIYLPESEEKYDKTNLVTVGRDAAVTGLVYSRTLADIRGTVNGTVITGTFYYYASPTSYYNWLKDCTIDQSRLPDRFAIPFIFAGTAEPEIVAWRER